MKKTDSEQLKKMGIGIVYLFGSRAEGTLTPLSDTDIGIVFKETASLDKSLDLYNDLYGLFAELYPSKKLDIVFLQSVPPSLQYQAIKDGVVLYQQNPILTADYEAQVVNLYLDFKPVLELFNKIAEERYAHV